jgi:bifunctional pyridoxal-dependent enzyme with beta-cystathionase and maltose regulon repressor activities
VAVAIGSSQRSEQRTETPLQSNLTEHQQAQQQQQQQQQQGGEFAVFQQDIDRTPFHTVKHTFCAAGVLPMWVADMDLPIDAKIHEAILARAAHPTFGYTIQPPELWAAVADWLRTEHGWTVLPEQFVFTGNLVTATVNAIKAFTDPGDAVAVVRPLYTPLQDLVTGAGRRLVTIEARPSSPCCDDDEDAFHEESSPPLSLDFTELRATLASESVRVWFCWCVVLSFFFHDFFLMFLIVI